MLERGREIAGNWNVRMRGPATAAGLGSVYALSGRIAEAIPLLEEAVEQATSIGPGGLSLCVAYLSEGCVLANRIDEARQSALRALHLSRQHKERGNEAYALRALGEIASHLDTLDVEAAGERYREAITLADELGMRPLVGDCHLGLGKLYRRMGKRDDSRRHLTIATAMYRDMDMRFWLEQAEAELRQLG